MSGASVLRSGLALALAVNLILPPTTVLGRPATKGVEGSGGGDRLIVRRTPGSVFYDATESRFYFYHDLSESDGRAGCSPAFVIESIPEASSGSLTVPLRPQPYCGPAPAVSERRAAALPLRFAKPRAKREAGFTILREAGLAIDARFPGPLPAAEIALFSLKELDAEVFRDGQGEIEALILLERDGDRSLKLQRKADGAFAIQSGYDASQDRGKGEAVAAWRWSQSDALLQFHHEPPVPGVEDRPQALAIVRAPELAAKLAGRSLRIPLVVRMVRGEESDGSDDAVDPDDGWDENETAKGSCFESRDGSCICLDPEMMCMVALFPFVWLALIDAFSD